MKKTGFAFLALLPALLLGVGWLLMTIQAGIHRDEKQTVRPRPVVYWLRGTVGGGPGSENRYLAGYFTIHTRGCRVVADKVLANFNYYGPGDPGNKLVFATTECQVTGHEYDEER